jgi:site-specific DNA recombinase
MQRAVIYCRVSSKEQVANMSLSAQERACFEFCQRNGIEVDRVFVEEGESAKTADRTELKALLTYCQKNRGRVQFLVIAAVDRFARNSYDHAVLRRHLAGMGITLRAASQPIDDSPTGKAMEGMLSVFAQLDNELKAAKVKEGMIEAARRGQWPWRAPLGFLHASRAEGGKTMIPDPERAPLVIKAFEMVASGLHTVAAVVSHVNELGLRTSKGEPISIQTFTRVLSNPLYAGRIVVPRWQVDVAGTFKPLIDSEVWWKVQNVLVGNTATVTPHLRNRPDFPLRGFVRCGSCGRPLTASWSTGRGGRYGYYHCPPPVRCGKTKIRREKLEADFGALLADLRPEPTYLALFREIVLDVWTGRQKEVMARRSALEEELRELKRRRDRLVEVYVYQQTISEEIYQEQMFKLSEAQTLAQMRLHDAQEAEVDVQAVLTFAEHLLTRVDRMWIEASLDQRQRLQRVLWPDGLQIVENRLVRTSPSILFFSVYGASEGSKNEWYPQRDSNPCCCLERAES